MDKKRDKFAKLRSKKLCSKIDGSSSQITNFFNPKISSSTSGLIGNDILSQQSEKSTNGEATGQELLDTSEDDPAHVQVKKRLRVEEKTRGRKRRKKPETTSKSRTKKSETEEQYLSKALVQQSLAENINPEDLQLALALSRSIADNNAAGQGEFSGTIAEDSTSSQISKNTTKFTLEEYGFKSSVQHNKKAINFLTMEKELKTFRKISRLLHRNPKKQDRLFNDKIAELLSKSSLNSQEISKERSSYHFLVTSQYLMECFKSNNRIMLLNSNPAVSSESFTQYYCGNLIEPSCTKIDALLRNWDDIPGREVSPNRVRKPTTAAEAMEVDHQENQEDHCEEEFVETSFHMPKRRSLTPDLLRSDEESTAKSSVLENVSIEISSDEEILAASSENIPISSQNSEKHSEFMGTMEAETIGEQERCDESLEVQHRLLRETVIIIDSDDEDHEEAINQSISRIIIEDHSDTKHLGKKSISEGFILSHHRSNELECESVSDDIPPLPSEININSLLMNNIVDDLQSSPLEEKDENDEEITFVCDALKNEDICVVRRRGVTPPPNYDAMAPQDIQQELKKYGLKAIKGRKAVTLLEHIYNQLHPFIQVEDKMYHLKCKYGLIDASTEARETNGDQSLPVHVDIVCKDGFLGDIDAKKCILPSSSRKKVPTCALPLHIAFYNYLQSNREVHERILQYEPVPLQEIQEHFKSMGIKYEANDLIEFLDRTCITFQTPSSGSRLRKSPRKKRNTNALFTQ